MQSLRLIATIFPLALTSGVNLYATLLVTGLCIRLGWIGNLPEGLQIFATTPVLIIVTICFLLEFLADKIHFIDTLWDVIHSVIRPVGSALLALAATYEVDPQLSVIAAILAGGVSFVSHTAKAGTRFSLNVISPFENVKNVGISIGEDLFVGIFSFFALKYPYITAAIALAIFLLLLIVLPIFLRWLVFTISATIAFLVSVIWKKRKADNISGEYMALLDHQDIEAAVKCKSQGVPAAKGRTGLFVLLPDSICFLYSKYFGISKKMWQHPIEQIKAVYLRKKLLVNVLEIHYLNRKEKPKICRFMAFKNRAFLLEDFKAQIDLKRKIISDRR
jgi:hypothetical protein